MNIHITVNSFKADIDSDDARVKYILEVTAGQTDSLEVLMNRQVKIARKIAELKSDLIALHLARDIASEAYSKFSVPHFMENVGPKEKCWECGKLTSWTWDYKPHCKNNDKPNCFDILREAVPLDSSTLILLENFLDEEKS